MKDLRCYAKISLKNLVHNFECIRSLLPDGCKLIPVIKADAYSHGAAEFAKALCGAADAFAVAELGEAIQLRNNGIKNDILILGYTHPSLARRLADNGLTQAVTDLDYANQLSDELGSASLDVHIKLDSGMHRFGFDIQDPETIDNVIKVSKLSGIRITGIFSHFAESDKKDQSYTDIQLKRFSEAVNTLKSKGISADTVHIANSAAILCRSDSYFSAVRPGIILYGAYPSDEIKEKYLADPSHKPLKEVMTLCARVGQVRRVRAGEPIGYSGNHITARDSVIATVTAGYADGVPRYLSNKGKVTINSEVFDIVGNICMDLLMVDITDAKSRIESGDEVIFWGEKGIGVDEYAKMCDTIIYTLYTGVSQRVDKIYE